MKVGGVVPEAGREGAQDVLLELDGEGRGAPDGELRVEGDGARDGGDGDGVDAGVEQAEVTGVVAGQGTPGETLRAPVEGDLGRNGGAEIPGGEGFAQTQRVCARPEGWRGRTQLAFLPAAFFWRRSALWRASRRRGRGCFSMAFL